mmetsp:Transcript_6559/g.12796  ORF Transcript_6559/g.12796 Transcript_6559/m.12796 type:complete len:204 (+) Transcript_6559:40-651(+)
MPALESVLGKNEPCSRGCKACPSSVVGIIMSFLLSFPIHPVSLSTSLPVSDTPPRFPRISTPSSSGIITMEVEAATALKSSVCVSRAASPKRAFAYSTPEDTRHSLLATNSLDLKTSFSLSPSLPLSSSLSSSDKSERDFWIPFPKSTLPLLLAVLIEACMVLGVDVESKFQDPPSMAKGWGAVVRLRVRLESSTKGGWISCC